MAHRADIIEMWRTMQERVDVMILPYSNPAGSNELLYRTHFPSKLTEYLALGMPVIVSGPEEATGLRYAQDKRQDAGPPARRTYGSERARRQEVQNFERDHFDILKKAPNGVVPCTTREELIGCLQRLRSDGELRRELAKRAVEAGRRDFDPVSIRETLWQTLKGAYA